VRRLPPLGSIQAFVHAARLGSVKAAADSLALSSPALTRRIQSLEQFIGTSLFERQNNSVQLNDRGKAFLADVEPHIEALSSAVERVGDNSRMRIRLAVPSLFASQRLMPALPSLRRKQPNLLIDVDTGANRISRLSDGVDVAIAITERVDEKHYSKMLERGRIVAIGSRDLAKEIRKPSDLKRAHVLLHSGMPNAFREWTMTIGLPNLEPAEVTYFDAGQLILDAAAGGLGVAFMFESHLQCSADNRLVQFFGEALERRSVRVFHDWLFDHFGTPALA
jgi:LysR family glycine cleavage system transcriptional activator